MSTSSDSLPTVSTEFAEVSIASKCSEHAEEIEILHEVLQAQVSQLLAIFAAGRLSPAIATSIIVDREDLAPGEWIDHIYADRDDAETAILLRLTEHLENSAKMFVGDLLGKVEAAKAETWQALQQEEPDAAKTLRRLSV